MVTKQDNITIVTKDVVDKILNGQEAFINEEDNKMKTNDENCSVGGEDGVSKFELSYENDNDLSEVTVDVINPSEELKALLTLNEVEVYPTNSGISFTLSLGLSNEASHSLRYKLIQLIVNV